MSLLGLCEYEDTSSSSSESEEEETEQDKHRDSAKNTQENSTKLDLPSPLLETIATGTSKSEFSSRTYQQTSVFYNPFKAEEKKKLDVLEKHVQLSSNAPPPSKNNKRICYKFLKGKCRFGEKCRFAHNTDTVKTSAVKQASDSKKEPEGIADINRPQTSYELNEEDEEVVNKPKKRKVGVTDSLVPPKRAMKAFEQQKSKEKPWQF